jgi:hypothetical protein
VSERRILHHTRLVLLILIACCVASPAGSASYWLDHGFKRIARCDGATQGQDMKSANGNSNLMIQAIITCTDLGESYRLDFKYLTVKLNPAMPFSSAPDPLHFDWLGLAIYKPADATEATIEWLYEEALPIDGELPLSSQKSIAFGNLSFTYPKTAVEEATRFTFFLTFRGRVEQFGLL